MSNVSRGFTGRRRNDDVKLPPGQHLATDFPVLSAGPTPHIPLDQWELTIRRGPKPIARWDWKSFTGLPIESISVDIHCVTHWSKIATKWEGVSVETLMRNIDLGDASFALVESFGGYSTNVPLEDLRNGKAWIAFRYDGQDLVPEHGGPARLLVPHLYFWKSAKWVTSIRLFDHDEPGFWETRGYHNYGDPWKEERYS